uniref:Capsular polysaccharide export system protein KpsC n=1 Tax=Thermosulfurimonas dismutans TaxID=999894 RepID=UPI0010671A01|nr:Chain A, Capsular polysaccharide export system protein KpsC [Thermosulfurimonas dismutans]6MGD_B Chain B, Capsular polysaccharide export system protein KpsC [Thermosulfurimonas dismutans]
MEDFYTYKFSLWKIRIIKRFFPTVKGNLSSRQEVEDLCQKKGKIRLLVWGSTLENERVNFNKSVEVYRLEDGFIRSIGLGIRLSIPISLVADPIGIYYDATKPSYLEEILLARKFDNVILERAQRVIELLRRYKITKYNISTDKKWRPPRTDKKIIVVPGQVESDASIKFGSPYIKTNLELLKSVREHNPNAYIVYKPHPDVVGGYRKGSYKPGELLKFCDEICVNSSSYDIISYADEVHVLTSLFGFEALIAGKPVTCYGHPFYAGYGLTTDIYPHPRRNIKLSLQELVAGALLLYPMYVSLIDGNRISAEEAIFELVNLKKNLPHHHHHH